MKNTSSLKVQILLAEEIHTEALVELLNKVTLNLHEKNINQWVYPWNYEEILKDIKNHNTYIIIKDKLIIGTFSIKPTAISSLSHIIKAHSFYLYRIAISSKYQGKSIGLAAVDFARRKAKASDKSIYLDCWAGNSPLRQFYSKAGFKYLGDFPEEDYMISVFYS